MAEPVWLREDVVLAIHRRQLAEHGGAEGIRDQGLLASALARAPQLHAYAEPPPDLPALAAAYAAGIARNHPFVDGNKRTAYVACRTFLLLNGRDIGASRQERYRAFLGLAAGEVGEEDLASWLRDNLAARERR